ncbi:MAG TPA: hypothetical protein VEN29_19860 [Casimicrobiaceae bacterium]|nr:hypothetical protein [Casimicrobiaceae bacterium]
MEYVALALGLALPWALGIAVLAALQWPVGAASASEACALRIGYGYCIGALLLTLWMRGVSAIGLRFGWSSIAAPLAVITVGLCVYAVRRGQLSFTAIPATIRSLLRPELPRWQQLLWTFILSWLALRYALLAAEIAWRPLYPWDAWIQWATKARVWYELGYMAPFVTGDRWLAGAPGAFFDASPNYPATVPLLQVWSCIALGRWDDTVMNWPWLLLLIALVVAVYGALRGEVVRPLPALLGAYLVASLPLLDVHVALAGYADLPMAATYTLAALALYRWALRRDVRDAIVALFLALCGALIKTPGIVWMLTLLPGVIVALLPRRGMRIVGAAFAITALLLLVLARTDTTLLGYPLHLDFQLSWRPLSEGLFLFGNWNLLWYGAIALAFCAWRHLREPKLAPLAVIVAAGLGFLLMVAWFTIASAWLAEQTTFNRATLHLAPLVICLSVLLWHELVQPMTAMAGSAPGPSPDDPSARGGGMPEA